MRFTDLIVRFADYGLWVAWTSLVPTCGVLTHNLQRGLRIEKITSQNKEVRAVVQADAARGSGAWNGKLEARFQGDTV